MKNLNAKPTIQEFLTLLLRVPPLKKLWLIIRMQSVSAAFKISSQLLRWYYHRRRNLEPPVTAHFIDIVCNLAIYK